MIIHKINSALIFALISSIFSLHGTPAPVKRPVTFLVYMAADNSLYPFADDDIQEMMRVGSNENVAILVYLCTKKPGQRKITRRYEIKKGKAVQIGTDTAQDSGDYRTVQKACQWALSQYPCDCFIIDFWDHGSGSLNRKIHLGEFQERAVCYDDSTGHVLMDTDLQKITQYATQLRNGKKVDIVTFDACLMSDIEIGYVLAPYTNYMVASQQTIPGAGFGYDVLLSKIAKQKADARTHAINMVASYKEIYSQSDPSYTLSAIDLSQINTLSTQVDLLAQLLKKLILHDPKKLVKNAIQKSSSVANCTNFDEPSYLDMGHLFRNILSNLNSMLLSDQDKTTLQTTLQNCLSLLATTVIAEAHGSNFPYATGLSIYFNQNSVDSAYDSLIWSSKNTWTSFLHSYVQKK